MKNKEFKRAIIKLFPAIFESAFERCFTAREVNVVSAALQTAIADQNKRDLAHVVEMTKANTALRLLESRLSDLEERLRSAGPPVAVIRSSEEPQEEVLLIQGIETHRIGLIKAVREVTNFSLREAKDLVDDVIDRQRRRTVFKGPMSKAAVAVRTLAAAGGVTERKEAF